MKNTSIVGVSGDICCKEMIFENREDKKEVPQLDQPACGIKRGEKTCNPSYDYTMAMTWSLLMCCDADQGCSGVDIYSPEFVATGLVNRPWF